MNAKVADLYNAPNIEKCEDIHLLTLSEACSVLEDRVYAIARKLPEKDRQVIEDYISTRNDLEVETVKAALRWGKRHYK